MFLSSEFVVKISSLFGIPKKNPELDFVCFKQHKAVIKKEKVLFIVHCDLGTHTFIPIPIPLFIYDYFFMIIIVNLTSLVCKILKGMRVHWNV